jgi:hypothetical protein
LTRPNVSVYIHVAYILSLWWRPVAAEEEIGLTTQDRAGPGSAGPVVRSAEQQGLASHVIALAVASWRDLDLNWGHGIHDFFTEDGVYDFAGDKAEGRDAIRDRFRGRRLAGERTTLHIVSNFGCGPRRADTVTLMYYVCVFGADGLAVQQVRLPTLLGTIDDVFEYQRDGGWLVSTRVFRPLFNDPNDRVGRRANASLR